MFETKTAAIVVIGNEILSGRTQDTNIGFIAKKLSAQGIDLQEVRVIPDEEARIVSVVNELKRLYTYLFTTGGIGATHDDITFASIAKAFGRPVERNETVYQILLEYYGEANFNPSRQRLAMMPKDVQLIANPVSKAPSFQIENVIVLAGLPAVMRGMLEDVLPKLKGGPPFFSNSVTSNIFESVIAEKLQAIQDKHPLVTVGSYPFYKAPNIGTSLVLRSQDQNLLDLATQDVIKLVESFGKEMKVEYGI